MMPVEPLHREGEHELQPIGLDVLEPECGMMES